MLTAIGLMSGTSMDGVDAGLLRTDGEAIENLGPALTLPYSNDYRARLRSVLGLSKGHPDTLKVEMELADWHAVAVDKLLSINNITIDNIDIIGFHGHTILHRPSERLTVQLGDGGSLAARFRVPVAWDFRSADVAAGGQGAPLVPLFHAALARDLEAPVAILNIGGVANVTWIGAPDDILAFDTGPGNGPMDDWVLQTTGMPFDRDGSLAKAGTPDKNLVQRVVSGTFFAASPPKSLDRNEFNAKIATGLSVSDGTATLGEITVRSIAKARDHFPRPPRTWVLCGGGRHNKWLVNRLKSILEPAKVIDSEQLGWDGDAIEAYAFGFLAVRVLRCLPLSLPTTTGVPYPMPGGRISPP